jgi:hypothetical protein
MEQKDYIVRLFHQINDLRTQIAEHWSMAQEAIAKSHVDQAITLLNAYFRMKTTLEGAEANLQGILNGYFAGQ